MAAIVLDITADVVLLIIFIRRGLVKKKIMLHVTVRVKVYPSLSFVFFVFLSFSHTILF